MARGQASETLHKINHKHLYRFENALMSKHSHLQGTMIKKKKKLKSIICKLKHRALTFPKENKRQLNIFSTKMTMIWILTKKGKHIWSLAFDRMFPQDQQDN